MNDTSLTNQNQVRKNKAATPAAPAANIKLERTAITIINRHSSYWRL